MTMTTDLLLSAYRQMAMIRAFEERVNLEMGTGEIPGAVHLYAGQEASAVGVCMHLTAKDRIASTHRGHGHCIAKGCDINDMMAEIYGRSTGTCRGRGGSMHIADLEKGMLGANGIVGGGPPLACGIIFAIEDNGFGEASASSWAVAGDVLRRAAGYDIPAVRIDGTDFFAVYEAAGEAIARARSGGGPSLLHIMVPRYYGHFSGDADTYRTREEKEALRRERDCLKTFRGRVLEARHLEEGQLSGIDREIEKVVDDAVKSARAAPRPEPKDVARDVYVSYP